MAKESSSNNSKVQTGVIPLRASSILKHTSILQASSLNQILFFSVISVITFFSDIMRNRNIQIEIKIFNFMNGLRILSGNFHGSMRGTYN